jgi:hypothetical protein
MSHTKAYHQILDQIQSEHEMRNMYAALGVSAKTLERAIQYSKDILAESAHPSRKRRPGRRRFARPALSD